MKQIVIGDIHGKPIWKDIIAKHLDYDRVIFIGDYLDCYNEYTPLEQLNNLREIIQLKTDQPDKVILLIGNHDHHYWPGVPGGGTSGYQPHMRPSFEFEFNDHKRKFQMCFMDENRIIYSHAGISRTWLKNCQVPGALKNQQLVDYVNDLFIGRPQSFCFYPFDSSMTGDNINQSPIWIRPNSLYKDKIENMMVVGHTRVEKIGHPPKNERRGFYCIDALDLSKEFLVVVDEKIKIDKI